ncbi:ATP-binding protein [Streptomyces sp. NBC_00258]|uniref:ATP-binding protein n=1 Tax=Streptomyces sp. NBC_00258 TaxID=2903642 RepID=UPI002E2DA70A|nr:LuxR C-terminal-related transcriptional regulator [Streptomyces sp. NBC_00258]
MTSVPSTPGNLPASFTTFVGRRREAAEARRLLGTGRLVTLTGAGGIGKTRLALEVATASRKAFPDGVWLVDLSPVNDPAEVPGATAAVLRVPDRGERTALQQLAGYLTRHQALIVLDNCEHLIDACAGLAQTLLSAAPDLRILATSRETLGITGERLYAVPPLTPDEAVELLRDRATAIQPEFQVTDTNRAQISRLCEELEGLPLAIELTAARLRALTVEQTTARLTDRFALLIGGSRTTPLRQRSLRGVIDWSYELCTPPEQLLWRRLSVFAGGFALDAAEKVCAGDGIAADEVLALLERLVAQSIVLTAQVEGLPRYRFLETIREYGRARLSESGEEQILLRRHRSFYLDLAERLADAWFGPGQEESLARLRIEHANLRVALTGEGQKVATVSWAGSDRTEAQNTGPEPSGRCIASSQDDAQAALRMVAALRFHWCADGFLGEGRRHFDGILAAAPEPTPARARALWAASWVALLQSDFAAAARWLDEAAELGEQLDDPVVHAYVEGFRGASAAFQGEYEQAALCYAGAVAAHEAADDQPATVFWLFQLAKIQSQLGDPRAAQTGQRALALAEARGERLTRSYALWALGYEAWVRGEKEMSLAWAQTGLVIQRGFNDHIGATMLLSLLAWNTASGGDHTRAAHLLGALRALSRDLGATTSAALGDRNASCEQAVSTALGPTAYEKALTEGGRHDSPGRAIAFALDTGSGPAGSAPVTNPNPLTRREQQVATLVAQGMTNRQIASTLGLSPRTVDSHIENIRGKLGFASRAQVAAWWAEKQPALRKTTDSRAGTPASMLLA